jgi:hypothetical protein
MGKHISVAESIEGRAIALRAKELLRRIHGLFELDECIADASELYGEDIFAMCMKGLKRHELEKDFDYDYRVIMRCLKHIIRLSPGVEDISFSLD